MSQTIDSTKRGFLKWVCRLTGGYLFLSLSPSPLKRVNVALFSEAHGQTACKPDTCTTRDACEGDSAGHTCSVKDTCDMDQSGDCTNDTCESDSSGSCDTDRCLSDSSDGCQNDNCESDKSGECIADSCISDKSGGCENDSCTSDKSGACTNDTCISDSSKACIVDLCRGDSSGYCENDTCESDSSGECYADSCTADSSGACSADLCTFDQSGSCENDECASDKSGACWGDRCNTDASGACNQQDVCVLDKSGPCDADLCRQDSSLECATSDTCALDMITGMRSKRQTLAARGLNRTLKWLYNLSTIILVILTGAFVQAQDIPIVIDASNAMFFPAPTFASGTSVTINAPVGAFLRDCDGDGVLEADTNGDGLCPGDPKVMDHRGVGTRELPPGTPFTGSFEFTCLYIPDDVSIIATGPLTIKASREVAVFGAMKLSGGANIATPVDVDARTSAWLSDTGNITLTTGLSGNVSTSQIGFADGESLTRIQYVSACDITGTAVRAIIPPEVTQGSVVTIKGNNLGIKKGKVALGKVKAKVKAWTPESITAEFKKVPVVPGPYASVVTPKKATPLTTENAYQVKAPAILSVVPPGGYVGDTVAIKGKFFGKKKGKLTLGGRKCKVTGWTMDSRTGVSEATFVVPKGLEPSWSAYTLTLTNKVGSCTGEFEIYDPSEED